MKKDDYEDDYDEYPESRIFFKFGDTLEDVEDKLYERDIRLILTKVQEHEKI